MHGAMRISMIGALLGAFAPAPGAQAQSVVDVVQEARAALEALPAANYVQGDPADSLYRAGRRAINRGNFRDAAQMFSRLRREFTNSTHVGNSYYYEAYSLSRMGGSRDLELALDLLEEQAGEHADATTRADAPALQARIESGLAQRGNSEAAARVFRSADPDQACDEANQEIRAIALSALLNMDSDRAIPILEEVLQSRDECSVELRRQAVFLVSQQMGERTVGILLDLAHNNPDPDSEVREQAVFWLSQVHTTEALEALESILRTSDDEELQENAVFALSQHGSARSTEILKEFAERADAPADLRENAIFWLGQSEGAGEYLRELYEKIEDEDLKENIVFGIAQSDRAADRAWLMEKALDEGEPIEVRKNALFWAGQSGIDVSRLAELYASVRDTEMKEQVIFVLSQLGDDREAVDQLMQIAETEEDTELKKNALFWLGQSGDPRVAEFLLRFIRG